MSDATPSPHRRTGRPRAAADRRDVLLRFRATPDEAAEIEARASSAGLTLSDFLRRSAHAVRISAGQRRVALDPVSLHHLALLGSNMNQIARVLNTTGDTARAARLDELAADVRAFLDRMRDSVR